MKNILRVILFLTAVSLSQNTDAQRRRYGSYDEVDGWSVTLKGGATQSFGELSSPSFQGIVGLDVNKGVSPSVILKLATETGNLAGSKQTYYNAKFRTDFYMISLIAVYNVGKLINEELPVNIGVYGGLGTMRYSSKAYNMTTGEVVRVSSDPATSLDGVHTTLFARWGDPRGSRGIYYSIERSVPLGVMVSMPIGDNFNAGVDLRYNYIRNDKIDATSGLDRSDLTNKGAVYKFWGPLSYSDTPNDQWAYASFYVTYKFGSSIRRYQRGI
jgi:hypothetical protein